MACIDGVETCIDELELALGTATRGTVTIVLEAAMPRDVNATVLRWTRIDRGPATVILRLAPRLAGRDHHPGVGPSLAPSSVSIGDDRAADQRHGEGALALVEWTVDVPPLRIATDRGRISETPRAIAVHYPVEAARGTAPDETLHVAVTIEAGLAPGESIAVVLGTQTGSPAALPSPAGAAAVLDDAARRRGALLDLAGSAADDARVAALVLAADRFLVRRRDPRLADPDEGVTVIAGYPWFGDWGRDTMISLPGLTLATGRHPEAARILRTWAGLVRDGLLPNLFPDAGGGEPAYQAIDAPLWFVHALGAYQEATGDASLARELRPAVEEIVRGFRDGTRFGIGMDPADGLVRGGEPGLQLTWMDAKVDGVVITPRHGKPVEIGGLWIRALRLAAGWALGDLDAIVAAGHESLARRAAASFRRRYFDPDRGWLRDVIDGPDGDDASLRPNQLLALRLVPDLVDQGRAAAILDAVGRHLVVPGGVRTLAPFEPGYRDRFEGPPAFRDSAYHQGPAWTWLLGPWIDAVARFRGPSAARGELARALAALDPGGTGAIPELVEPEPPHAGRGCPWQAWGVAELLRCAVDLAR